MKSSLTQHFLPQIPKKSHLSYDDIPMKHRYTEIVNKKLTCFEKEELMKYAWLHSNITAPFRKNAQSHTFHKCTTKMHTSSERPLTLKPVDQHKCKMQCRYRFICILCRILRWLIIMFLSILVLSGIIPKEVLML